MRRKEFNKQYSSIYFRYAQGAPVLLAEQRESPSLDARSRLNKLRPVVTSEAKLRWPEGNAPSRSARCGEPGA